jgi:hypothetical protein
LRVKRKVGIYRIINGFQQSLGTAPWVSFLATIRLFSATEELGHTYFVDQVSRDYFLRQFCEYLP